MAQRPAAALVALGLVTLTVVVALSATGAEALFFRIAEGEEKCFLEDVPEDVLVVVHYHIHHHEDDQADGETVDRAPGLKFHVVGPAQAGVLLDVNSNPQGRFAFHTDVSGIYRMCVKTNTSRWYGTGAVLRVDMEIDVGDVEEDYEELAIREGLTTLELSVKKMVDKASSIRSEQSYQKRREWEMRDVNESTNERVAWWSVIFLTIVIVSNAWQSWHLSKFFKSKKYE